MKRVLIISNPPDPHADKVQLILKSKGIPFIRLDTAKISSRSYIGFESPSCFTDHFTIVDKKNSYHLSDIHSVWLRKPDLSLRKQDMDTMQHSLNYQHIREEFKHTYRALLNCCNHRNIFLVDGLISNENNYKLIQLNYAHDLGIDIPATIVSSDKRKLLDFLNKHPQSIIKALGFPIVRYGKITMSMNTYQINKKIFFQLTRNQNINYPVFLQEEISKAYELRINVIGNQIFACKIELSSSKKKNVDWRMVPKDNLIHTPFILPKEIESKLFALVKRMNLQFGAIDMAVTPEGKYVFFEINPNGQYLWIEHLTKQPLSEAMANLLSNPQKYALK